MALDTQSPDLSHDVSRPPPGESPDAAAVRAWAAARDAVLRGLVHALSNRVGTVAAVGGMLDGAPSGSVDTAARVLAGEGERLEALLAQFRLVTADPFGADAVAEPLHVGELLGEAAALAAHGAPDAAVRADVPPDVRPAVASRAAVVQALLVLVRAAGGAPGSVTLRAAGDGGTVRIWAAVGDDAHAAPAAPNALGACAWLLGAATVRAGDGRAELRLPALGGG